MRRRLNAVGCGEERIGVRSVSRGSETSGHHSGTAFIRITKLRRHGPETPVAALAACCVVNGFVNETRRNCRDGERRGGMAGTGD